jgi:hypothetical protein
VGQELIETVVGPTVGDLEERVGQVRTRVHASGVGGRDEREHLRDALGTARRAGKEPRASSGGKPAQAALGSAVVDLEATIDLEGDAQLLRFQ